MVVDRFPETHRRRSAGAENHGTKRADGLYQPYQCQKLLPIPPPEEVTPVPTKLAKVLSEVASILEDIPSILEYVAPIQGDFGRACAPSKIPA
ncbi:MAG TPA: hypothetical protein VGW77_06010 [Candidatus Binatia bacterium]|jgi:hypothetical protein|nr:hypothetical protein [Candidatus Binatia bacterium]